MKIVEPDFIMERSGPDSERYDLTFMKKVKKRGFQKTESLFDKVININELIQILQGNEHRFQRTYASLCIGILGWQYALHPYQRHNRCTR